MKADDQVLMQLWLCKQSKFLKPQYHKNAQQYDYTVNIQMLSELASIAMMGKIGYKISTK